MRVDQIETLPLVPADPQDPESLKISCLAVHLGRTKRGNADEGFRVLLIGRPADALTTWLDRAGITSGAVFRAFEPMGSVWHQCDQRRWCL